MPVMNLRQLTLTEIPCEMTGSFEAGFCISLEYALPQGAAGPSNWVNIAPSCNQFVAEPKVRADGD